MNKKFIIIFGSIFLLLIIIVGGITYYQEEESENQTSGDLGSINGFSTLYPVDVEEFINFINFCDAAKAANIDGSENEGVKEIYCTLGDKEKNSLVIIDKKGGKSIFADINDAPFELLDGADLFYLPSYSLLSQKDSLNASEYIGISVDLEDAAQEYNLSLLGEESLYVCSVFEPLWLDPLYLEYRMPDSAFFSFDEGGIMCDSIGLDDYPIKTFAGFVPQAESLNIRMYLVNKETIAGFLNEKDSQSFSGMEEALNNFPLIWQIEKPINI